MKKTSFNRPVLKIDRRRRVLNAARLSSLLACFCFITGFSTINSQTAFLSLRLENATIREVLNEIEERTDYAFLFSDQLTRTLNDTRVSAEFDNSTVEQVLDKILASAGLEYKINDRQVLIVSKEVPARTSALAQQPELIRINGAVADKDGKPLPGVNLRIKGTNIGTATKSDGTFTVAVSADLKDPAIMFTFIGLKAKEVPYKGIDLKVTMEEDVSEVEEVVVQAGIFQRDKISFTGAVSSYNAEELKAIGNQNVLESLKVLDPSFVIIDDLEMGSNPNRMGTIELRGQGSATLNAITDEFSTDPNQPLFVINGVESTLSRVNDLDINRIESITILKDAGSTAIYGSKGANGVVVIETIKPTPGVFRIYYNGDYMVKTPDLSVFNMMNAAEKLEFERLSGKYSSTSGSSMQQALYLKALTELYNQRLADVQRGVDTYWLHEPVRTGFTHGHSVRASGGDERLAVDIGGKYKNEAGVMKKSGRETWAGDISLTYRSSKVIVTNMLDISGYVGKESPYGSFSTWVNTSPYFKMRNDEGGIDKFLHYKNGAGSYQGMSPIESNIGNPLYNALLNSKDDANQLYVSNSFSIQYAPVDGFRVRGGIDMSRTHTETVSFTPPENTKYADKTVYYQGEYYSKNTKTVSYKGYVNVSYASLINDVHSVTFLGRGQIRQDKNNYTSVEAVGFPFGSQGTPNLAHSYKEESSPGYYLSDRRSVSLTGAFNYNYDKRYLLDLTYSIDGATTFGSNKLYKSFWSAGIGWNIDREAFLKDAQWLETLKLRATTGMTGNQNQGRAVSETVYKYYLNSNVFGQGIYVSDLANPDLPWQTARDYGIGLDFRTNKGRYSLSIDLYRSKTDPNIVFVPQVPSTGVDTYPMELGYLKKQGAELILSVYPVYDLKNRIMWGVRLTGAHNRSEYGGLGSSLNIFNEQQRKDNTLQQYVDGYSPTDIWAVRSYGIDPATGEEIYIKKNGELTKEYSADEMVVVGNTRPDLLGVISTNLRYKNFYFNMSFRYSVGGDIYNYALYNKVENITKSELQNNQDKRALYDRWKNPGDMAKFRAISIVSTISPKTSRFVQKNNYLRAESISCSYELNNNEWLKNTFGAQSLKVTGYLNDIFRLETSKTERGTEYPFARNISFSLNLSF